MMDGPDASDTYESAYETFSLWTNENLKSFLSKRGWTTTGNKEILTAKCVSAWVRKDPIVPSIVERQLQIQQDYSALLVTKTGILPDPRSLKDGWIGEENGMKTWPPIYINDVSDFLMRTHPDKKELTHRLLNEYKEGKAYRYFSSQWLKEVFIHHVHQQSDYCFLKAKCTPSQRLNDPPHDVWVCAQRSIAKDGLQIQSAYCTCAAGMTSTCNHVAGVLFRVEAAVRSGATNPAKTSLPCWWTIPSQAKKGVVPCKIADLDFKQEKYGKKSSRTTVSVARKLFEPVKPKDAIPEKIRRKNLLERLKPVIPNACIFPQTYLKATQCTTLDANIDESMLSLKEIAGNIPNTEDGPDAFLSSIPVYSPQEIHSIQLQTVQQSKSPLWEKVREGRITASNFYRVWTKSKTLDKNPSADVSSLVDLLCGMKKIPEDLPQFKYGQAMEIIAQNRYKDYLVAQKHTNIFVARSGIFIDIKRGYLAASPDFLVTCCCGSGLMECKAPYSLRDQNPADNLPPYLTKQAGLISLKENHAYFAQIQGQMAISGRLWCDLLVVTDHGHVVIRIKFNQLYWENMALCLESFYKKHVVPRLLQVVQLTSPFQQPDQPPSQQVSPCQSASKQTNSPSRQPLQPEKQTPHGSAELSQCSPPHASQTTVPSADSSGLDTHTVPQASKSPTTSINKSVCPYCKELCPENPKKLGDNSISCDKCDFWFHFKCVGIKSKKMLKKIEEQDWFCNNCK